MPLPEPRGEILRGTRALAGYIFGNPERWRTVRSLDREQYGLVELGGELCGFKNWIDAGIASQVGKRRRGRKRSSERAVTSPEAA